MIYRRIKHPAVPSFKTCFHFPSLPCTLFPHAIGLTWFYSKKKRVEGLVCELYVYTSLRECVCVCVCTRANRYKMKDTQEAFIMISLSSVDQKRPLISLTVFPCFFHLHFLSHHSLIHSALLSRGCFHQRSSIISKCHPPSTNHLRHIRALISLTLLAAGVWG